MTKDEIIDWLYATACQYGPKRVSLDGKHKFIDTIATEAVKELTAAEPTQGTKSGPMWRRLRDGSTQCVKCKGIMYEVRNYCPICGEPIGGRND